ncbi:MAG: serine/threonine-protein kinase [Myxococcaceae bacterium]
MDPQLSVVPNETVGDSTPELGASLGPYRLEAVLGEGTMGRVYLGKHQRLGRQVALKVLHARHTQDASLLQRFLQEAKTVNQINHEHIVEVYDFIEELEPHRVYCVMELLKGQTLAERMKERALEVDTILRIGRQIAGALGAAHAVGVVHRDLKPDNCFLVSRGGSSDYVKVLDFGVAKLLTTVGQVTTTDTQNGTVIGTPRYMSPEQAAGLDVDHRADIYSFGTVLYELLAGKTPFEAATFGLLAADLITRPPPPLPERTHGGEAIPSALNELVMACLQKQPSSRPATMAGLVTWLQQCTDTQQLQAVAPPAAEEPKPKKAKVLPLAIGAGVLALAAVAFFATRGSEQPPVPAANVAAPVIAAEAPKPAAAPKPVRLSATTTPPGASVVRADTKAVLGTTPLDLELSAEAKPVMLEFTRAGYQDVVREVSLDRDQHLEVLLNPTRPAREAKPAKKKGPVREGVLDPFGE